MLPCLIFEDDHLLVVNKPAGLNTHAPAPYAGEGLYDWLRHRKPRWSNLAIIHRLDKETSGVIVFSKSAIANRALTEQFASHTIRKTYLFLTDRAASRSELSIRSALVRAGEKYLSRPVHVGGTTAETRLRLLQRGPPATGPRAVPGSQHVRPHRQRGIGLDGLGGGWPLRAGDRSRSVPCGPQPTLPHRKDAPTVSYDLWEAEPLTGRTHQIRVHAAQMNLPILGDELYSGSPAPRLCLHAAEITLRHPVTGEAMTLTAEADFDADPRKTLRTALLDPALTDSFRLIQGASDGRPGWYVDQLGDFLLSQSEATLTEAEMDPLARLRPSSSARGIYHKTLIRRLAKVGKNDATPKLVLGEPAPERFLIRENSLQFEITFNEGYSVGLFLDQRDNRYRVLNGHVGADFPLYPVKEVLNAFAYTCGFSVCAAKAGARVTSLDLSKKYLAWGKRNFELNQIDPAAHDFIYGDVFDWLPRLAKKQRAFDVILLDPPTFSRSKEFGIFQAEKDYEKLVASTLPLLKPKGVLFCSSNAAGWPPGNFLESIEKAIRASKRKILQQRYFPQPPDFPISRAEPAYLKTVWLRLQ